MTLLGSILGAVLISIRIGAKNALLRRVRSIRGLPFLSPLVGISVGDSSGKWRMLRDVRWGESLGGSGVFVIRQSGLTRSTISSLLNSYS